MRSRTILYLLALLFLVGCSGGGSSSAGGGVPAPPPGPQLVSMKLDVAVPDQAQRGVQGRSQVFEVVAEVVDRNSLEQGTLSGRKIVSRGAATVGDEDRTVKILLDIIPGIWDIYIFGLDSQGKVVALFTIDQLAITPGVVIERKVNLQFQSQGVVVNPANQAIQIGQQLQFSALVFLPAGTSTSVTWVSDDPAIATVDANGLVTGGAPGTTNIRAISTVDNSLQGFAQLTVLAATVQTLDLVFSDPTNTLQVGQVGTSFLTTANLSNNTTQDVTGQATYTVADPTILTVDPTTGAVTALAPGTTTVLASFAGVDSALVSITVLATDPRLVVVQSNGLGNDPIVSFTMDTSTGALTQVDSEVLGNNVSFGMGADNLNDLVFVSRTGGNVVPFLVDAAGLMTPLPVLTGFTAPRALDGDNRLLYVVNGLGGVDTINTFLFDGVQYNPVALGFTAASNNIFAALANSAIPALFTGSFGTFNLDGYTLAGTGQPNGNVAGSPLSFVTAPTALAYSPNNDMIIAANTEPANGELNTVDIDSAGNILGQIDLHPLVGSNARAVAVHPNGFVYVAAGAANTTINVFQVDAAGIITALPAFNQAVVGQVFSLAIDPTGSFLVYPELNNNQVTVRPINADGSLGAPVGTTLTRPFVLELLP